MLEIKNIHKSYGEIKALDGVSLNMSEGVYGLLGPNGSGKTTLISILTDNLRSDKGDILFDGKNALEMGVDYRSMIGYMPQYPGLYPNFTVWMFMMYICTLKGLSGSEMLTQSTQALEAVELYEVRNKRIRTLSGGMKQRLALAQAVVGDPKILILDEPTAGLDPNQRISIRNYISKISIGKIIIIATHVVSDVEFIAREVIFLKRGTVIAQNSPDKLIKEMDGNVWTASVQADSVAEFITKYKISNIKSEGSTATIRIISETKPCDGAEKASPSLEDSFLYYFNDHNLLAK